MSVFECCVQNWECAVKNIDVLWKFILRQGEHGTVTGWLVLHGQPARLLLADLRNMQNGRKSEGSEVTNQPIFRLRKTLLLCVLLPATLIGCSRDPLETKLKFDGRLTKSEIEAISIRLSPTDGLIFKRWGERMNRGEAPGGEVTALIVRDALLNQQTYELQQAQSVAKVEAAAKAERDREAKVQQEAEAAYSLRQAVNAEVRKYIDASISTYQPQMFYDQQQRPASGVIEFKLKLKNHAPTAAIGIVGFITINDVFGRDLGSYPFALEPRIGSGQTISHTVVLNFDRRNEQHHVLWRAKTIISYWFFESAAFEDGTRIDADYVSRMRRQATPAKTTPKPPNV